MPRTFNIITNIANGAGLQKDYELLRSMLESRGNTVHGLQFTDIHNIGPSYADVNIFIEVIPMAFLNLAPEQWLIPNSEWWDAARQTCLPRVEKILCKTQDALTIWQQHAGAHRCHYIGFESPDLHNPQIERQPSVLHLAGKSGTKNTVAVLDAWKHHGFHLPPLTLVTNNPEFLPILNQGVPPNVTHIRRVEDISVPALINSHLFHLMPAQYEGFGHCIHEAMGCGSIVLTTNAPPMNESAGIPREYSVPVLETFSKGLATLNRVSPDAISATVIRAVDDQKKDPVKFQNLSATARAVFESERADFRTRFEEIIR